MSAMSHTDEFIIVSLELLILAFFPLPASTTPSVSTSFTKCDISSSLSRPHARYDDDQCRCDDVLWLEKGHTRSYVTF